MVIVGAVILPHGAMTLDPSRPDLPNGAEALHAAAIEACQRIAKLQPSLIVLSTPHGLCLTGKFGVYLNERASGNAEWNGTWGNFTVNVALLPGKARELLEYWKERDVPAEGISAFSNTDMPLRWGECIPLWFLQKAGCDVPVLILSQPATPSGSSSADRAMFESSDEFKSRQLHAGKELRAYLDTMATDERVVVVISGDLAHTHAHDCTNSLYTPDPRWKGLGASSEAAEPFDEAIACWARTLVDTPLLVDARRLVSEAKVCGYSGMVMLHALLRGGEGEEPPWGGEVLACCAPTYYGMIVAVFVPTKSRCHV